MCTDDDRKQVIGVVVIGAYSAVATAALLKAIDLCVGIRVTKEEEARGMDETVHGEKARRQHYY